MSESQTCPRRLQDFGPWERKEGLDRWEPDHHNPYRNCSFCGSLHPDDFMRWAESGEGLLGATDKNYKVYVGLPDPRRGEPCVLSSANYNAGEGFVLVTPENVDSLPLDAYQRKHYCDGTHWVKVSSRGAVFHGKFYFQHLSAEQQQRFVELMNAGTLKFQGAERGFYRMPFFAQRVPSGA